MVQKHTPVLIVGAGGAGLSLSLLLLQQGIASLVIERRSGLSWFPRARNLNFRTLEIFRGLGLEAEIRAAGTRVSRLFRKSSLAATEHEELLDPTSLVEHLEEISPEPFAWYCPQSQHEPRLIGELWRRGGEVRYDTELVSFTQDEAGATSRIVDRATGTSYDLHSDYLIAADGAHSKIRETPGIGTKGLGELAEHQIFVYFRADWSELIRNCEGDAVMIVNEDLRGLFLVTDQKCGIFVIIYSPREEAAQDYSNEHCKSMLLKALSKPDLAVEIVDIARWQPIERVADRFQEGRIFLVGDSAHTMPPKMGLGLNTAIQSAQNLAWKLAAVLKGHATPQLLSTYQTERHPVGRLAAERSLTGPAAALFQKEGEESTAHPLSKQFPFLQPIIGYRYRSAAIVGDGIATPEQDGIELLDQPLLNGFPGTRVPHLWVERQGQRISTLDLLDGRFVLFAGPGGAAWCETAKMLARRGVIDLAAYCIGPRADLLDVENNWQTKMDISAKGAVLVRPDGFVAWRANTLDIHAESVLEQVLSHILCRSPAPI
jgi:2-polyprenyl-6-methoxyphenol hydroxylase-like FAD-dependent oxidoreductase